ncbi:hypothetical protein [Streptomyces sp. NPDC047315]|uniref:hypothetical protein n=1 Tax=Streptomyces sp. NPDC047315 TaxID=3155142 RepID=UPI00340E55CF
MHDGGGDRRQSMAALPTVIEGLLERDLHFVSADALLGVAEVKGARRGDRRPQCRTPFPRRTSDAQRDLLNERLT